MQLLSFFKPVVVERVESEFCGEIVVKKFWREYWIQAGGLTQSGGIVDRLWEAVFSQVEAKITKTEPSVLIFGLGAGSILPAIYSRWAESKVLGVEIDEQMIRLGKQYSSEYFSKIDVRVGDAFELISSLDFFDIIVVDLYTGAALPEAVFSKTFLEEIAKRMGRESLTLFNLALKDNQLEITGVFEEKLADYFKVSRLKTAVNSVLLCLPKTA